MFPVIKLDYKTVIATALVGAAAVFVAKKGVQGAADWAKDNLKYVNPASPDNLAFRWTTDLYKTLTGSSQAPGADAADVVQGVKDAGSGLIDRVQSAWDLLQDAAAGEVQDDEYYLDL